MQDLIDAGAFLEVVVLFGEIYGIAVESLDAVTKDGKVGVMCMELDVSTNCGLRFVYFGVWDKLILRMRFIGCSSVETHPPCTALYIHHRSGYG